MPAETLPNSRPISMSITMNTMAPMSPQEEALLFQAPDDLLCPIMHTVMRNPVITEVGTMYEEAAIRNHLTQSNKDPLSNQFISDDLRPVYLVRSKAKEYATNAARRCMERDTIKPGAVAVLDPECDAPAKYLRRACDLCEEADVLDSVPSLSPKIVTFALQHRSSMHDIFLLIQFATDLASNGNKPGALALFRNLLRLWTGKLDQTAVIKRCLKFCWLEPADDEAAPFMSTPSLRHTTPQHHSSQPGSRGPSVEYTPRVPGTRTPGALQGGAHSSQPGSDSAAAEPQYNVEAILDFMRHQRGLRATDFVDVLANLGVPRSQLILICKGVLSPHIPDEGKVEAPNAYVTPRSVQSGSVVPQQVTQNSAFGDLPTSDLGIDASDDQRSGVAAFKRSTLPNSPLFSTKAQQSGGRYSATGGMGVPHAAHSGGLQEPSLTQVSHIEDGAVQRCTEVTEALALVPRLVEMVQEELREDSAAKVASVGRDLTAALGIDAGGVADMASLCDTRDGEPAEVRLLQERAAAAAKRKRVERSVAIATTFGAVLVPGGIGRLLASVPALVVLFRN